MWFLEVCCAIIMLGVTMMLLYFIYLFVCSVPFMAICLGMVVVPALVLIWVMFVSHVREKIDEGE